MGNIETFVIDQKLIERDRENTIISCLSINNLLMNFRVNAIPELLIILTVGSSELCISPRVPQFDNTVLLVSISHGVAPKQSVRVCRFDALAHMILFRACTDRPIVLFRFQ